MFLGGFIFRTVIAIVLLPLVASGTSAQSLNIASGSSSIEITADNGIEWQQDNEIMIARGNAKAVRDENTIEAQILKIYYRRKKAGGADIIKLEAAGDVKIYSLTDMITGARMSSSGMSMARRMSSGMLVGPGIKKLLRPFMA